MPHSPLAGVMASLHKPIYESRLRVLTSLIAPRLHEGDRVLDVGCGFGQLGEAIMAHPQCPKGVRVEGLERVKRGGERIPVGEYDGAAIPFPNDSFDCVIIADVLHHEQQPDRLFAECTRVASRAVFLKDHARSGPLAQQRISLIDWAANAPYGVPCLYRYNTPAQWREHHKRHGLTVNHEQTSIDLYPPGVNLLFGRGLQYFAMLEKPAEQPS